MLEPYDNSFWGFEQRWQEKKKIDTKQTFQKCQMFLVSWNEFFKCSSKVLYFPTNSKKKKQFFNKNVT